MNISSRRRVLLAALFAIGTLSLILVIQQKRRESTELQPPLVEARATPEASTAAVLNGSNVGANESGPESEAKESMPCMSEGPAIGSIEEQDPERVRTHMKELNNRREQAVKTASRLRPQYSALGVELGITDAEVEATVKCLAESLTENSAKMADIVGGRTVDAEVLRQIDEMNEEHQRQIEVMLVSRLGYSKYQQLRDFEETIPVRMSVASLTVAFSKAGSPLTPNQSRSLTDLMIPEYKQRGSELAAYSEARRTPDTPPSIYPYPSPDEQARVKAESAIRVFQAAAAFLDTKQMEILRRNLSSAM